MEWSKIWPTESGWYWFYGNPWARNNGTGAAKRPNELYMVKVHVNEINGQVFCNLGGGLMYAREAVGVWQPTIVPELPED